MHGSYHISPPTAPKCYLTRSLTLKPQRLIKFNQLLVRKQRNSIRNARSLHSLNITPHHRLPKALPLVRWQHSKRVHCNGAAVLMVAAGVGECGPRLRDLGQAHGVVCDEVGSAFCRYDLSDEYALFGWGGGVGSSSRRVSGSE